MNSILKFNNLMCSLDQLSDDKLQKKSRRERKWSASLTVTAGPGGGHRQQHLQPPRQPAAQARHQPPDAVWTAWRLEQVISKFLELSDSSLKFSLLLTAGWEIIWKKSSVLRLRSPRSTRDRLEIYSLITSTRPQRGWRPPRPSGRPRTRPTSCWRRWSDSLVPTTLISCTSDDVIPANHLSSSLNFLSTLSMN